MSQTRSPVAVIGPTGTGKSGLALDLAERLDGEIVNCDALQQYRGMDIGTAKVPENERRGIPHHCFDTLDVTETASVADYQATASAAVEEILDRGRLPVIVGGSMLYIQSLLDDWQFPATDARVREKYEKRLAEIGVEALHVELAKVDPVAAETILPSDPRRTVRALEVIELTGKPFAASRPTRGEPRWGTVILGLRCALDTLDERLRIRTDEMFDAGLVDEVCDLLDKGLLEGVTARRAIGYSQILEELDGARTLGADGVQRARERTFIATRRYVRRQRSWFGRDERIRWLDTDDLGVRPDASQRLLESALAHLEAASGQETR